MIHSFMDEAISAEIQSISFGDHPDPFAPASLAPGEPEHAAQGGTGRGENGEPSASSDGGHITISPPSNGKTDDLFSIRPLTSGIDTLVVSLYVSWESSAFFESLETRKKEAASLQCPLPFPLPLPSGELLHFNLLPHGSKGYSWVLNGLEYSLSIGNWLNPKTRPSISLAIRSETAWRIGPLCACQSIFQGIVNVGGTIVEAKATRVDYCLDILVNKSMWSIDLLEYSVCRSHSLSMFKKNGLLQGAQFGKNDIVARIYDKLIEITTKSSKYWMYLVWGIDFVPEGQTVLRVEFQLRREAIKQLGLDTVFDVISFAPNAWRYLSQKWLKFSDNMQDEYKYREVLPWWAVVQDSFEGVQDACPLIRAKAIEDNAQKLAVQMLGYATSYWTVTEHNKLSLDRIPLSRENFIDCCEDVLWQTSHSDMKLHESIETKKPNTCALAGSSKPQSVSVWPKVFLQ